MLRAYVMWTAWPAFLVAGILEMMLFAVLDPAQLTLFGEQVEWSREAIYSITFFILWGMIMLSTGLSFWLARPLLSGGKAPSRPMPTIHISDR